MSDIAISANGLGKRYRIGALARQMSMREKLTHGMKAPVRWLSPNRNGSSNAPRDFWALRNVSFELRKGEVLGLIGRNGAGKSTLLKILSRVTQPTEGSADIHGRVGSLLEVGTGFHPDLTGRENVYLNGAILGMGKREIDGKFDEIVAFAEVADFIDTPLKHYSTGMQMRLAFAVAAHFEPQILLLDEVLAVGDLAFQKKCLGKMGEVAHAGRTILLVSHNMAAVRALCSKAMLLRDSVVAASGRVADVIAEYSSDTASLKNARQWSDPATAPGNENVRVSYIRTIPPEGEATITIDTGALIEIGFDNFREGINLDCTISVISSDGILIFESPSIISSNFDSRCGFYHLKGRIPAHLLNAGRYLLTVNFGKDRKHILFRMDEIVSFDVENTLTGRGANFGVAVGFVRPILAWQHSFKEECSVGSKIHETDGSGH